MAKEANKQSSASDLVKEIRKETARREKIWAKMEAAAREAVAAVKAHARSRKVEGMEWFTSPFNKEEVRIKFIHPDGPEKGKFNILTVRANGILVRYCHDVKTYEGYPDLTDKDPDAFKKAAVEQLMSHLNKCIEEQQLQNKANKKKK